MYPLLRFAWITARARKQPRIGPDSYCDTRLTAWPWDLDFYLELNNGRQLTLFDLGRFDYGARIGLIDALRRRSWGLTVAGSSMYYRKRIAAFERFTLRTRLAGRDERWFYMVQTILRKDVPCSQGLIRIAVLRKPRGIVPTDEVVEELGYPDWRPPLPEWIAAWDAADKTRPWPPQEVVEQIPN